MADEAAVRGRPSTGFTDPLSAGYPDADARARLRLRLAGALLFASGALTMGAVLAAPDPDTSDHPALTVCAVVYALVATVLVLWRRPPAAVLHAICPLGTIGTTAAVAFAEPLGLTPIFYLWPAIVAAYFFGRREVAVNYAFLGAACGLSLVLWCDPVLRLATFMAVMGIVGVVTLVIAGLREHVLALVVRLGALASRDSLTGALNRGAFEQRLNAELARAQRAATRVSLVVLDVDHFKRINDTDGHAAGDEALRAVGAAVLGAVRRSDVFGRLGGDEFAVVLPDTDADGAMVVAGKLRERMGELSASFGVAEAGANRHSARTLLAEADRALYEAKRAGRDRVVAAPAPAPLARVA
jgi:diguanylate cyclase (GGDEF)-like protein